ncbi:PAS domain-containing protein [Salisaeta longa]|uniref:PAS domain-containing protein n=1 Tax=Salisaeta longa TaxID=503170 RepID=UPI0003B68F8D|nr:PAS domain-containing protein [Salisaeta longa]
MMNPSVSTDSAASVLPLSSAVPDEAPRTDKTPPTDDDVVPLREVEAVLHELHNRLERLRTRHTTLIEQLSTDGAETPVAEAYREMHARGQRLLDALGVDGFDEGIERVRSLNEQLNHLYDEKEQLTRAGFTSVADVLAALDEAEARAATSATDDRALAARVRNVFDITDPADVEALHDTLQTLKQRTERFDAVVRPLRAADVPPEHAARMIANMRDQLEALYDASASDEARASSDDAPAAAAKQQHTRDALLERRIRQLRQRNRQYAQHLDTLKRAYGAATLDELLEQAPTPTNEKPAAEAEESTDINVLAKASEAANRELVVEDTPPLTDPDTLDRLERMSAEALAELPVGLLCVQDDGIIRFANDAALALPVLPAHATRTSINGRNFFDLVPSTDNNLFRGRFRKGVAGKAMDIRFPYTFITPTQGPVVINVHLHRKPAYSVNWILMARPS